MIILIPLVAHILMSLIMLALPSMTRREILFGVVVPADFRSSPEGRSAIHQFRIAILIPAFAGAIAILMLGSRFIPVFLLAPTTMLLAGFTTFVWLNRRLRIFAVQPQPMRELELNTASERLPWFAWLGVFPLLLLLATGLYLNAHWDSIPSRFPIHYGPDGNPNQWADRSFRGVYGPLIFGAGLLTWLFGFALAVWYGSRRSEPLRKPIVGYFIAVQWALAVTLAGVPPRPLIHLPLAVTAFGGLLIAVGGIFHLVKKSRDPSTPLDPTPNECWKGGMLYYNPNDAALFVARRDGIGFTSNMGNPWSWVMLASLFVLIGIGAII
jgi:uncharacterized membrane protein